MIVIESTKLFAKGLVMGSLRKTIEPRTAEEIEALKTNWRDDPIWDIEDTEGFELHRDELVAYRLEWEVHWKLQRERRLASKDNKVSSSN